MRQVVTKGIVLTRTNYQEAARIITLLTPDGKVRVLAKGVRKSKSKMAGGIELFSIAEITYMPGKGELATLISARLQTHYGNIVRDINRTMYGYDVLKRINKITEEAAEKDYFYLLEAGLKGLDDFDISLELNDLWFSMQLLKLTGHAPNLRTDITGKKLVETAGYIFSFDDMAFELSPKGSISGRLIKVLRLSYSAASPLALSQVKNMDELVGEALQMVKNMSRLHHP